MNGSRVFTEHPPSPGPVGGAGSTANQAAGILALWAFSIMGKNGIKPVIADVQHCRDAPAAAERGWQTSRAWKGVCAGRGRAGRRAPRALALGRKLADGAEVSVLRHQSPGLNPERCP